MNKFTKKIALITTSLALCVSVAVSSVAFAFTKKNVPSNGSTNAAAGTLEEVTDLKKADTTSLISDKYLKKTEDYTDLKGKQWVIVTLEGDCLADKYYSGDINEFMDSFAGSVAANEIEKEQRNFLFNLSANNIPYELKYSYNTVTNGVAINVDVKYLTDIAKIDGVKEVAVSEYYYAPKDEEVDNNANVENTGIYKVSKELRDNGYDGSGMVVAVLDTGLDSTHQAFRTMPDESKTSVALTKSKVNSKIFGNTAGGLTSRTENKNITANDVYYNSKVPFAFDYADNDADVYPSYSHHGTHVAGIIAGSPIYKTNNDGSFVLDENGNKILDTIKDQDGNELLNKEGETMTFTGVAPNAQLAIFKVFSDNENRDGGLGGAETMDILCALEDCVKLGVDVINMSLGSSAGFTKCESEYMQNVYDNVRRAGISLMVAASNDYSSAYNGTYGTNLASNPDSATVGAPSTYTAAMSVASINGQRAKYIKVNVGGEDKFLYYTEASDGNGNQKEFIKELKAKHPEKVNKDGSMNLEYVVVPGYGQTVNYANISVAGKVAVVQRGGDVTFEEKVRVAKAKGAIACVIYNNVSGTIRMSLGNLNDPIPTCSITMDAAEAFVKAQKNGSFTISESQMAGPFMSEFSSWGPTPDLKLKPEISAHGGEIISAVPNGWEELSGTSMATPNLAGAMSLVIQYVKKNTGKLGVVDSSIDMLSDAVSVANRLFMSTATIANDTYGSPYSPRKQGAGLADIEKSMKAEAYLYVKGSDKSKVEVGDDKNKTGVYTLNFSIKNFSSSQRTYTFDTKTMTETLASDKLTVAERAYMLDGNCSFEFTVNGTKLDGNTFTLAANADWDVQVKITLNDKAKKYIDDSFKNGMYVEGFVLLKDTTGDASSVDLNIPWLGFYGDWYSAPMFDISDFELSEKLQDDSIPDKDKPKAQMYATQPLGSYYDGKYIIPLGSYLYTIPDDMKKIYSSSDKAVISIYDTSSNHTVYQLYAIYAGLLRGAKTMNFTITDAITGEVVYQKTTTNVRKAYTGGSSARGSLIEVDWSPVERSISNNREYLFHMEGVLDSISDDRQFNSSDYSYTTSYDFTFRVDTEAPVINDYRIRFDSYKDATDVIRYKVYLDIDVYDNQYSQSVALCYADYNEMALKLYDSNVTPIYSNRNSTTTVTLDVTDYYEAVRNKTIDGKDLYLQVDDYALNTRVYRINEFQTFADSINYPDTVTITSGKDASEGAKFNGDSYSKEITIGVNESAKLDIAVNPSDAANVNLFWKSYASGVVEVNNGELFGKKVGDALVRVYAGKDETATAYDTILVHVVESDAKDPSVSGVSLGLIPNKSGAMVDPTNKTVEVHQNELIQFSILTEPWYYDDSEVDVRWTTSSPEVATVNANGQVKTIKEGVATITATIFIDGNQTIYSASATLSVGAEFIVQNGYLREYHGAGGKVTIPKSLNVYYIYEEAFKDNKNITELEISSPCTEIQERAFANMAALKRVILPHTLNYIYKYAFYNCTKLEVIDMHARSIGVGEHAFEGCTNLKKINNLTLLNGIKKEDADILKLTEGTDYSLSAAKLTTLNAYAFKDCTSLAEIDLTELRVAGNNVFNGCTNLKTVKLSKFTDLGEDMFLDCTSLGKLVYTDLTASDVDKLTLTYDTKLSPFGNCNITEIEGANGLTFDGGVWYKESEKKTIIKAWQTLTSFTVPASVEVISANAFSGNKTLASITFVSGSLKEIGNYAFSRCTALKSIQLPATIEKLGVGVFSYCSALETADLSNVSNITKIPNETFLEAGLASDGKSGKLGSVTVNASVTEIGDSAFEGSGLTKIDYSGTNISVLGDKAFASCKFLQEVKLGAITDMGYAAFAALNDSGVLGSVSFGAGSTALGEYAFADQTNLTSVVLSDEQKAISEIPQGAFRKNEKITNLGFTSIKVAGDNAFKNCKVLTLDLSALENAGKYAFYGCKKIEGTNLSNLKKVGEYGFYGCESLRTLTLDNVTNVGNYAFAASGVTSVTFGKTILPEIEKYKEKNKDKERVLKGIGDYAFYRSALSVDEISIKLGTKDGISAEIGDGAFSAVKGIGKFSVTDSANRFEFKDGMLTKKVNAGLEVLAFAAKGRSGSITIPEGAVRIAASTFENVKDIVEVSFPYELKSIGDKAFFGCSAKKYSFGSLNAPILENAIVSADGFAEGSDEYKIFSDEKLGQTSYANFNNYVALILNAGRDGVVGVKGFDIEVSYPENAKGFDNRIFAAFFSKVTKTEVVADDNARSFNAISAIIPTADEINSLTASDNAAWNEFREVMTKARNAYDNVSESQRVFLSGADKFIASEAAMRAKAATFGETLKKVSITVSQKPDKTEYVTGETFDSKGLKLVLLWSDGSKEELDGGFNIENKNRPLTQSNRTVRITYEGLYTTLNVTVGDPAVEKVEVKTQPTKLNYEVGDKFQTAGLTLLVTFVNGDTKTIYSPKEYTIEQGEFAEGDNIVKITYGGKTVEITVHVGENKPDPKPGESDSSTDSSSDTDSTITSGSDASSSTKNNVGLIVGVSVGAVVVLAGVAAAIIFILKKRKIM